jgi:hypothetical protein
VELIAQLAHEREAQGQELVPCYFDLDAVREGELLVGQRLACKSVKECKVCKKMFGKGMSE